MVKRTHFGISFSKRIGDEFRCFLFENFDFESRKRVKAGDALKC